MQCNHKAIKLVRGNDTNWNGVNFLTFNLNTTVLDLSTFKAVFKLGNIIKTINDISSGSFEINLTAEETKLLPQFCNGILQLVDEEKRIATIESLIPFEVVSTVHGDAIVDKPYELTFNVDQEGETILNISLEVGISVEVGTTTTLPAGTDACVENVGSNNRLVLNFGIPQGEQGEPGPEGEQGPQGEPGQDGAPGSDATINGYNTLTITATDGITLAQSGPIATISGNDLQTQIDALAAASDVTDIVGTYAELQAYDTSKLKNNDIVKVLQDETHSDETTYYRWVITEGVGAWGLIGEEGPYYTIASANATFVPMTRTINNKALSSNITLDYTDVGATKSAWGSQNANKNLVTDANGDVTTSDYALGQIIVDYYNELPIGVPETAKATVLNSSNIYTPYTVSEIENAISEGTQINVKFRENAIRPSNEQGVLSFGDEEGNSYEVSYTSGNVGSDACFTIDATLYDGSYEAYIYSWVQQQYIPNTSYDLSVGWNKAIYDENTSTWSVSPILYSDMLELTDIEVTSFTDNGSNILVDVGQEEIKLSGEYIYVEVTPSTTPKTYYWQYNATNMQSDMSENNPLSLSYIKNRAILDTRSSLSLTPIQQTITGTITLHKISKTGAYSDLIGSVGVKSGSGEIFNCYEGVDRNYANGSYAHAQNEGTNAAGAGSSAEGLHTIANGAYQHVQGKYNISDTNNYAHIVGNGTDSNNRSNAHTLDWSGNAWFAGDLRVGGTDYAHGSSVVTSVNNTTPVNGDVTLSIPTVNDATITFVQGGVSKGSITLNQSSDATIALDAGGGDSLPSQTGHAGEFLKTDGTDPSWGVATEVIMREW